MHSSKDKITSYNMEDSAVTAGNSSPYHSTEYYDGYGGLSNK